VVARGVADILQIVVLAAGAHAFLRRGGTLVGPRLGAGEHVLELHHAGIGEQQGGIVERHQRRGIDDFMAVPAKEFEKCGTDFAGRCHILRELGLVGGHAPARGNR
jgi:hypothetical protein